MIDIIPKENFSKKSIKDKYEKTPFPYEKNIGNNKNTNVIIAEITWLSVKLEINTPKDAYAIESSINPHIVHNNNLKFIFPNWANNKQYKMLNIIEIPITIITANIFPEIIEIVPFEDENNNFSVSLFRSSEKDFIVSTEIVIGNPYHAIEL